MISTLVISALPIIFAITMHEAAHGYVARQFGDSTAWRMGRISLNPLRHIDMMGTIVVPAVCYLLGGFMFGWAKPVPVDFGKLRNPKRDMIWVAAAGPASNFVMAFLWAGVLKLALTAPEFVYAEALQEMARAGIRFNAMLMVLNLLPLPPLDGGRILTGLLPLRSAIRFARIERWGFPILILLLVTHILELLLFPPLALFLAVLMKIFAFQ